MKNKNIRESLLKSLDEQYLNDKITIDKYLKLEETLLEFSPSDLLRKVGIIKDKPDTNKRQDHSFILNYHRERFPYVRKIVKIDDLEEVKNAYGKFYRLKLFFHLVPKGIVQLGFLSKDKSFKKVDYIEFFDKTMVPRLAMEIKYLDKEILTKLLIASFEKTAKRSQNKLTEAGEAAVEQGINYVQMIDNTQKSLYGIAMIVIFFFIVSAIGKFIYKKLIKDWNLKQARTVAEVRINNSLFVGQYENDPAFSIYNKLTNTLKTLIHTNKMRGMIIYGPPGMSKTYIVRRVFYFSKLVPGRDYSIEKGSSLDANAVYSLLYENKDNILVLDDLDDPLKDPKTVNLLKACTDSYSERIVSHPETEEVHVSMNSMSEKTAPVKFVFNGKVILITNLKRKDIDLALLSRIPSIRIDFDTEELIKNIQLMLKYINPRMPLSLKQEVYDYIMDLYNKNPKIKINFRSFQCAFDARIGNPENWKELVNLIVEYDIDV